MPGATPARLSVVLCAQALPQLVFILLGGVIADRMPRARLMVGAEILAGLAWAGLATLVFARTTAIMPVVVLAFFAGLASALFFPAMSGMVPEIVADEDLQRANAYLRIGQNLSLMLGLVLSGVVVALVGAGWAIALNAASFLVSAALIGAIRVPARVRKASTLLADLRQGGREFFSRQWLWVVVAQYSLVVAAVNANVGVLGPLIAVRGLGGAQAWAVIVGGGGAAGTIGGAVLASRIRVGRPLLVAVLATFPAALPMLLIAGHAPVWLCAVAMLVVGVSNDVFSVLWATTLQREIPGEVLSRVSAYDGFGSLALAPLGLLVAGPIAAAAGAEPTLVGCAALVLVGTAGALLSPQVRQLRSVSRSRAAQDSGQLSPRR
ncbi:MFS transporter [Fodinicola feengrottensis]|uniref:MFS transporter n=1 Tax=Fodinicola feengrottensis TaxID=435914 RepID=UPI0024431BC3|nr:MFS transporter [Fodinicola feengrottensis]